MIITCAECATQFQLDEARVPESGIRVRCSVCKHAFFVPHPNALEDAVADPVERGVREALDADARGLPEASADLEAPETGVGRGAASDEHGAASDEHGVASDEDWEFNDGGRLSDASVRDSRDRFEESFEAAREAVDDLLGSPWERPVPVPEALPPEPVAEPSEPLAPAPLEGPGDELEVDPELALTDDPWETPGWSGDEAAPGAAEELELGAPGSPSPGPVPGDPEPLEVEELLSLDPELPDFSSGPASGEELPDPDDLELADEGDPFEDGALAEALVGIESVDESESGPFGAEPSAAVEAPAQTEADEWGLADEEEHGLSEAGEPRAPEAASLPIPFDLGVPAEPRLAGIVAALAGAGNALGWGAVAILATAALWASVAPRSAPAGLSGAMPLAGLEATELSGRWVENATLGPLFVVSGTLGNPGSEARAPGSRLVVRLLDAQGAPLDAAPAGLAAPLSTLQLRESRAEDLRAISDAGARELAHTPLPPGARIPFEAVVLELPDAAQRFELAAPSFER